MRRIGALVIPASMLVLGCDAQQGTGDGVFGPRTGWSHGTSVSADGARFTLDCSYTEWAPSVQTVERLVPSDATDQWANRDVTFQFDNGPVQRAKGTLRESSLLFWQSDPGSTIQTQYGQDIAAGLMRGNHKTLTIRTTDGADRPKEWRFDVEGSAQDMPVGPDTLCPIVPARSNP
jgi:hypothetical protein